MRLLPVLLLIVVSCSQPPAKPVTARQAVQDVVRASITAENSRDADAFLKLWTDKGLATYDVGTRDEVRSGTSENFGSDRIEIVAFPKVTTKAATAEVFVDGLRGVNNIAKPVYRIAFGLIRKDSKWLIEAFKFLGSPTPPSGSKVVPVVATEYAFAHDAAAASVRAFKLTNSGGEPHELTLFKGPDGVDLATAKKALEGLDGQELADIPDGYAADHLSFAEAGKSVDVFLAEPLKPGTYLLACYIPEGGFNQGEPVKPDGRPHISVGMISRLSVT